MTDSTFITAEARVTMVIAMKEILVAAMLLASLLPVQSETPCILIDTGHGGYPLRDGRLTEFRDYATEKGFSVHFKSIGAVPLNDYCLVLSVNPDSRFTQKECTSIRAYLVQGGTFFLTGAGDFENRDHSDITNPLLKALHSDIRFNDDQVTDIINSGRLYIPLFDQWQPHPLTQNLPPISLYSPQSVTPKKAYPLLQGNASTESKDTDGSAGPTPDIVTLLAGEPIGKGDLIVGGSWGFVSGLPFTGHQEFIDRLLWYVVDKVTILNYSHTFQGASLVVGQQCRPEVDSKAAETLSELLSKTSSHQPECTVIIGGPQVNPFCEEINSYLPIQFGKDHAWYFVRNGQKFYGDTYGIVAVITVDSKRILVAAGLGGTGTAGAVNLLEKIETYTVPLTYNQYGEAVLLRVQGDENHNGVPEESESWHIIIL
jgi:hypothetical protein